VSAEPIPFNRPYLTGNEIKYIQDAHERGQLAGDGFFTGECSSWIEQKLGSKKALLTHSCTAALEIAAALCSFDKGDEVLMPSYTFVSTANAFLLHGARPVFVDIRLDTLNIDENLIEDFITSRTRAIVVVHYAGVPCEMRAIRAIAAKYGLIIIEDAAQAFLSEYEGQAAGTIGEYGCYSFHETKNIISGEGGALIVNNASFIERAEIIREKGTNRSKFFRGEVDKYTWVDVGSSYLPGEIISAFLWAQLLESEFITRSRMDIWRAYHKSFQEFEDKGIVKRPCIPKNIKHNAHMYYLRFGCLKHREDFIRIMKENSIHCVFHYVPLHSSPFMAKTNQMGDRDLPITNEVSKCIVRLPLWLGVDVNRVVEAASKCLDKLSNC